MPVDIDKSKLEQYAELKGVIKAAEAGIKELAPVIKAMIAEAQADKVDAGDLGVFSLKPVLVWKYSSAVDELEAKVDELKAKEKAEGIATSETRTDLVFTAPKPKTEDA